MSSTPFYRPSPPRAADEVSPTACTPQERITRSLLGYGVIAGPVYVAVSVAQGLIRDGFDFSRHEWSLLANGPWGWLQVVNLIITGLMVVAAAVGFRRRMTTGTGSRWVPRLLAVYGISLVAAGTFTADPMLGFPVGTPEGAPVAPSLHGVLHFAAGGIGFLALIVATLVLGRRFVHEGRRRHAAFTVATAIFFLAGFAGIASGSPTVATNLMFTAAVVLMWTWLSAISAHLYRDPS
jgi:hypothetical membrane protein